MSKLSRFLTCLVRVDKRVQTVHKTLKDEERMSKLSAVPKARQCLNEATPKGSHRLGVQDTGFSFLEQGFKSPWDHHLTLVAN